jgi:diguanylate cyclase (GGDEF)-like protein
VSTVEETIQAPQESYELTLFVSGASDLSSRAIAEAKQLCEDHVAGRYHLSVVDVHGDTSALRSSGVLATPTLIKYLPLPVRHLVGDLSKADWSSLSEGAHGGDSAEPSTFQTAAGSRMHSPKQQLFPIDHHSPDPFDVMGGRRQSLTPKSADQIRMEEMEEMLRAIGAGEVDGFVVTDNGGAQQVFTMVTADHPFRMFVESMRDGAATVSSTGLILFANQPLAHMLRCPRETLVGLPLSAFIPGGGAGRSHALLAPGKVGVTVELELLSVDGAAVPVRVGSAGLDLDGDHLTCLTFTDLSVQRSQDREIATLGKSQADQLSHLRMAQAALIDQATHDPLTGLSNRVVLVDRIDRALAQSERSGACTAVLFVDLDEFKHVNDTQGHAAGDSLLRNVADTLVAAVRSMDTVARIGGDEFVVLAPGVDTEAHAVEIGNHLLRAFSEMRDNEGGVGISASIGISVSVGGRGTAEILLQEADKAMYQVKSNGGGHAGLFDVALRDQLEERLSAQSVLQSALDERRIVAYFQPIVDLSDGMVTGFEALARLIDFDGSIRAPATFIPIAEDTRLVVPLGGQMLAMACGHPSTWDLTSHARQPLTVAVNVSGRQFESGELPSIVQNVLDETALAAAQLHLELVETSIIDLHPDTLRQLRLIRELGVEIGLDDFGTGYASLTHLRRLPLSFVKIDRSFVDGIDTDRGDERIVSAVIDLAANLGLRSIAEGVETPYQLEHLRKLGCDQAQGYLFAKPLSPSDVRCYVPPSFW